MSESICVTLEKFTTEKVQRVGYSYELKERRTDIPCKRDCSLELKLSFDGNQHFIEEAWLDETIDFYAIADKYGFLDNLLEEALKQLKLDKENARNERGYIENLD